MTTDQSVLDAIDRLHVVRAALDDQAMTELGAIEAFAAVRDLLISLAETTRDCDCERCNLVHSNALHAMLFADLMPLLALVPGDEHPLTQATFRAFTGTVEMLVHMHEEESQ